MHCNHLGGFRTIDAYVNRKLAALHETGCDFSDLFSFMFSEKDAILYERSMGYKIVKTTYGEARDRALCLASDLRARFASADHSATIGLYMENSVEWIETFWAILAAGFCPLLLNLRLDPAILEKTLADCGAIAVIADHGAFSVPTVCVTDLDATSVALERTTFGTQIFVMSTGTSSRVKVCSYGAKEFASLVSDSAYIIRACAQIKRHYKGELKLLTFLPFYHVFGLIAMYIWFAFFARTFVHLNDLEPATILNTVRRHEVTHIFAVPLFWERIYDTAERTIAQKGEATLKKYRKGIALAHKLEACPPLARAFRRTAFSEVREQIFGDSVLFMITGGSPIRQEALAFFNDIGYHLTNGYGMTEIGITSVELSMRARQRKTASVGKPLPSISYRISEEGELLVRGASLASAIRQGSTVTLRGDDWFHTGDLAECVDGTYRILGRTDDLILLPNGEMLNPNLIEPHFHMPGVSEVCLINAADGGAVRPTLILSVDGMGTKEQMAAMDAAVTEKLKAAKLDTQITGVVTVVGSLLGPHDFKVNRAAIARRYAAGELLTVAEATARGVAAESDLEIRVASVFAASLGMDPAEVSMDADFFRDCNGSSLDYFAMISALKETFGLPFSETDDIDLHTVRGICRYIEGAHVHTV